MGDENYMMPVNQIDSQIENKKYSQFLANYLKFLNLADIILIKKHYHYKKMIPVGSLVQYKINN